MTRGTTLGVIETMTAIRMYPGGQEASLIASRMPWRVEHLSEGSQRPTSTDLVESMATVGSRGSAARLKRTAMSAAFSLFGPRAALADSRS